MKDQTIVFRVSEEEKRILTFIAMVNHMSLSAMLRKMTGDMVKNYKLLQSASDTIEPLKAVK